MKVYFVFEMSKYSDLTNVDLNGVVNTIMARNRKEPIVLPESHQTILFDDLRLAVAIYETDAELPPLFLFVGASFDLDHLPSRHGAALDSLGFLMNEDSQVQESVHTDILDGVTAFQLRSSYVPANRY